MEHQVFIDHEDFPGYSGQENALLYVLAAFGDSLGITWSEVNVIVQRDIDHTALNIKYLGHEYSTDILTFDMSSGEEVGGEIYINWDVCVQNAEYYNESQQREFYRLMIHGVLHLIGWHDHTEAERSAMRLEEDRLLSLLKEDGFM